MSTWALVGAPNSGKTTLYNWLTGSKSKTVNYPGSTVEYSKGLLRPQLSERVGGAEITLIDTPGVYSLMPQSEDEQVTHDVLFNTNKQIQKIDGVVVVLDATQLSRHLLLAKQVIESHYPVLFVITMRDLIEKEKMIINLEVLKAELGPNIILYDGMLGQGLNEIVKNLAVCSEKISLGNSDLDENKKYRGPDWTIEKQTATIGWAENLSKNAFIKQDKNRSARRLTNKLDSLLLHPIFGFVLFFLFMSLLFSAVYWMAAPVMDVIDSGFSLAAGFITEHVPGLTGEFLGSGLITAIGGVVIFIPQIFILFIGIGILESTGYLARVAALVDKPLSFVGLGGRSFVPLLSGFACAIPAIMATRNITSKKERIIAQSIIPFMTCSARLPVYALLIGFMYGNRNPVLAGILMSSLYFGAILIGALAARMISFFIKDKSGSRLLMELPLYRRPHFGVIFMQSIVKAKSFLFKAGPIILSLAIVLWFASNFPRSEIAANQSVSSSQIAQQSYAAQLGQLMEPIFRPLGVDWRVGFSLISAFAAREVFVSSLALMFNIEDSDETQMQSLTSAMQTATFSDGTKIFTTASVVGILIFFMIALQCTSTVSILKREMGSWKPALLQLFFSNLAAYGLAVSAVSVLKSMGY